VVSVERPASGRHRQQTAADAQQFALSCLVGRKRGPGIKIMQIFYNPEADSIVYSCVIPKVQSGKQGFWWHLSRWGLAPNGVWRASAEPSTFAIARSAVRIAAS